jgi:hypothetical protein
MVRGKRHSISKNYGCKQQFPYYAKMILSHTMSMNPDDNGNLPPVTFRSRPWLA